MSFLAPMYLAGLLAVSLPLIFHLIRRTPTGQVPFSSLMFLSPSPPRLTRKSRLDNLLLLLLRAAALLLLGTAFARPFLRAMTQQNVADLPGRKVALLIDTSASMRRDGIRPQVLEQAAAVLDDLGPGDDVALIRFDSRPQTLVAFEQTPTSDNAPKIARIRKLLRTITPGWHGSNLGQALVTVADDVNQMGDSATETARTDRQIVLISDLQQGCQLESLRNYRWPEDVQLTVRTAVSASPTNAGLHLAASGDVAEQVDRREDLRVRVTNSRESTHEQFQLQWQTADAESIEISPLSVYVPSGETRVVRVPRPHETSAATRLVLAGDDHPFDNRLHLVSMQQERISLAYIGGDPPNDPDGLRYYLERAFPETARRVIQWTVCDPKQPLPEEALSAVRLVVVGAVVPDDGVQQLTDFISNGGTVLVVVTNEAFGAALARLMGCEGLNVTEAKGEQYAMLGKIAFSDPLFARFADPRFSDFTKIHFWKHRRVDIVGAPNVQVLAGFDNGDPALVEQRHGPGRLLILTSGWHPMDSQLARSTKFVPLLSGILERAGGQQSVRPQYNVGDFVVLPTSDGPSVPIWSIRGPSGAEFRLASDTTRFEATDEPGIYQLDSGGHRLPFAVNVVGAESETDPLPAELLQEYGVQLGNRSTREEMAEEIRQMRDVELEQQQKVWRWLIVAAIGILIVETWLAGYLARPAAQATGAVR
jgi:hypothetical protein